MTTSWVALYVRPDLTISLQLPDDLTKEDVEYISGWLATKVSGWKEPRHREYREFHP